MIGGSYEPHHTHYTIFPIFGIIKCNDYALSIFNSYLILMFVLTEK